MQTFKLSNGVEIPVLGFGVFQISPEETEKAVLEAIEVHYRHSEENFFLVEKLAFIPSKMMLFHG